MPNFDHVDEYSTFMETLMYCFRYIKRAEEMTSKRLFPVLAIVTDNKDPEQRRRIKIADPLFGGLLESNWVSPIRVTQNYDPPLPQINQMVIIWFIDGDSEKPYYLPIINDTNPSRDKENDENDESYRIEGNRKTKIDGKDDYSVGGVVSEDIGGDRTTNIAGDNAETIEGDLSIRAEQTIDLGSGGSIFIHNDSGAFLSLTGTGIVVLQDAAGRKITLGGVGGLGQWDLNNLPLTVINANSFKINNKEIATVGALDSRGDSLTTKGW